MVRLAGMLRAAGAARVRWLDLWQEPAGLPALATVWPQHFDAADWLDDFVPGQPPDGIRELVRRLLTARVADVPAAAPAPAPTPRRSRPSGPGMYGSVSDALQERYGLLNARPGRNVRCPMHDDRRASLHVLPDDQRAYCHADGCAWGQPRGVIAADIRQEAHGMTARATA